MRTFAGVGDDPARAGLNSTCSERLLLIENQMPLLLEKPNCQRTYANQWPAAAVRPRLFACNFGPRGRNGRES
jgi:hypothetical protein